MPSACIISLWQKLTLPDCEPTQRSCKFKCVRCKYLVGLLKDFLCSDAVDVHSTARFFERLRIGLAAFGNLTRFGCIELRVNPECTVNNIIPIVLGHKPDIAILTWNDNTAPVLRRNYRPRTNISGLQGNQSLMGGFYPNTQACG